MDFWNNEYINGDDLAEASASVLNVVIPALEDYFNGEVFSIEKSDESLAKFFDRSCGIDAFVRCNDGTVFGLAHRVHYTTKYKNFLIRTVCKYKNNPNSFNVRTEIDHITRSGIKPRYHVCTRAVADGYYIAIAKTTDIVDYINNNYCKKHVNKYNGSECKLVPYSAVNAVELFIPNNTDCDDF